MWMEYKKVSNQRMKVQYSISKPTMNLNACDISAYRHQQLGSIRHKSKQIATQLADCASTHVQAQLKDGLLDIVSPQTHLNIDRKEFRNEPDTCSNRLAEILEKKENMLKQLQIIKQREEQLKSSSKQSLSRLSCSNLYYKSELTAEDLERWKTLKMQGEKFQKGLEEKTEQYELRMKKLKEEEEQTKQALFHEKQEQRKRETEKTIIEIEKRKIERESRIEDQKRAMKQMAQRKKLHNEWYDKWKIAEDEQQRKKKEILNELKQMRKVSHEQIRKHEKKYDETMKTHKESRMKQLNNANSSSIDYSYRSVFLDKIKQDDRKLKELEELKKSESKQFLSKIKEYGQKVKVLHRPTIKPRAQTGQQKQIDTHNQSRSLSLFETHQLGNEYMRTANTELAGALKQRSVNQQQVMTQEPAQKYKNYLRQLKKSESPSGHRMSEMSELKCLLQKQNLTQEQKLFQAKLIADKLESKKMYDRSPNALVSNINAKIEILKHIEA